MWLVISGYTRRPDRKTRPPLKHGLTALQVQSSNQNDVQSTDMDLVTLTTAQIREMINTFVASAFTSMGINGPSQTVTTLPVFNLSTALSTLVTPSTWLLNSGASNHMTCVEQNLHSSHPYVGHDTVTTTNGLQLSIFGIDL